MKLQKKTLFGNSNLIPSKLYTEHKEGFREILNRSIDDSSVRRGIFAWLKTVNTPVSKHLLGCYIKHLLPFSADEQLYIINIAINGHFKSLKKAVEFYIKQRKTADNISE